MKNAGKKSASGFSLVELLIALTVMLIALGVVSTIVGRAFGIRSRESRTADALATSQAAISVMAREIANSGFGLYNNTASIVGASNGIVLADSNDRRIRVRSNFENEGGSPSSPGASTLQINMPGEDVTYFFDPVTRSIVRYDHVLQETSVVVNRISNVTFSYVDYAGLIPTAGAPSATPSASTGRVRITVEVELDRVAGQPDNQRVRLESEVTLRNNNYMLQQY